MTQNSNQQHPTVIEMLSALDDEQREFYEERAGVLEYEAGLERKFAEMLALLEVIRRTGWPLSSTGRRSGI